jgi:hypothetical protein
MYQCELATSIRSTIQSSEGRRIACTTHYSPSHGITAFHGLSISATNSHARIHSYRSTTTEGLTHTRMSTSSSCASRGNVGARSATAGPLNLNFEQRVLSGHHFACSMGETHEDKNVRRNSGSDCSEFVGGVGVAE